MTIKELAMAAIACILILGLSLGSNTLLDRYLPAASGQVAATAQGSAACVDAKGKWVNWPWANAPTLTLPCTTDGPKPDSLNSASPRPAQEKN